MTLLSPIVEPTGCSTPPALLDLIRVHRSAVMAQAIRMTGTDRAWAEEVVQDTFIRAWQHLDRMNEECGSVRAWLLRVAHNVAVDGWRRRRPYPMSTAQAETVVAPSRDHAGDVVGSVRVHRLLGELSVQHRAVIEAIYLRDQSTGDVARGLGVPVGTVKSRTHYALRQLRELVAADTTS